MEHRKMHVTPGEMTRKGAKAGLVVVVLLLLFGLGFGGIVLSETPGSEVGLKILIGGFFGIWVTACITIIVLYIRVLSRPAAEEDVSLVDVHLTGSAADETAPANFDERLRKLVQLKTDGLITEAEFEDKRKQLLGERW